MQTFERAINRIVLDCSFTSDELEVGFQELNYEDLQLGVRPADGIHCRWHYIVKRDGSIQQGRQEYQNCYGLARYNSDSLYVCLVGGSDTQGNPKNNFTNAQRVALTEFLDYLHSQYPDAVIQTANEIPKNISKFPKIQAEEIYG